MSRIQSFSTANLEHNSDMCWALLSGVEERMCERHADVIGWPIDEIPSKRGIRRIYHSKFTNKAMTISADKKKQTLPAPADYHSSQNDETDNIR